jgi:predicted ATP-grasp superfamily ATP-dependent carboligase
VRGISGVAFHFFKNKVNKDFKIHPTRDRPPAIVTNAKNRIAYNIVRSLGQKGIDVHAGDFVPRSMSFVSRYAAGKFLYPSPFSDPEGFINYLVGKVRSFNDSVLIPVFEETFLISKFKDRFSGLTRMVIPDYDQILTAHNKDRWEPLARELGIAVPKTYPVNGFREGGERIDRLAYPLLVKPKQGGGGWAITQVNSAGELESLLNQNVYMGRPWDWFFLQEKIIGEVHCVAMLFRRGELRAKVAYKQLRDYPVSGGQATLRVSIRSEAAEKHFERFLEKIGWQGVCQADFVVDQETGVPYLIDINPRFWGSLVQAIASGVDFPYLLYRIAVDGDAEPVAVFRTGVTTRWLGGDCRSFWPLLKKSRNKLAFIRQFCVPKEKSLLYDDFSWQDPFPFCSWSLDTLLKVVVQRSFKPAPHDSLDGIWQ